MTLPIRCMVEFEFKTRTAEILRHVGTVTLSCGAGRWVASCQIVFLSQVDLSLMYDDIANSLHSGILIQDEDCRFCDALVKSRRLAGQADVSLVVKSSSADLQILLLCKPGTFDRNARGATALRKCSCFCWRNYSNDANLSYHGNSFCGQLPGSIPLVPLHRRFVESDNFWEQWSLNFSQPCYSYVFCAGWTAPR